MKLTAIKIKAKTSGGKRTLYVYEQIWESMKEAAQREGLSISEYISAIHVARETTFNNDKKEGK